MTLSTQKIRLILELRRTGITHTGVMSAFEHVPRDLFVPDTFDDQANLDVPLPIGFGQTISQPTVVARMLQALSPNPMAKVLEIGTGSGYQTALLSRLFRRIYTVEREPDLQRAAQERLLALRRFNVTAKVGDGSLGWLEQAPFDRIILSAAVVDLPPLLWEQLRVGGVMVLPMGEAHEEQRLFRLERTQGEPIAQDLGPVRFLPLTSGRAGERMAG